MNNRDKSALALALAIVGGAVAGTRCDASVKVDNSSQYTPSPVAYTVRTYTEGSDPFDAKTGKLWDGTIPCPSKPLRIITRNICGDETEFEC